MKTTTETSMKDKFNAFQKSWYDLCEGWDKFDDDKFSPHYPFQDCFRELRGEVKQWVQTSIEELKVTKEDMAKSRTFLSVSTFEEVHEQDTDLPKNGYLVSYFDTYYIGIIGTEFHLVLMNNEYTSNNLAKLEQILWNDFLEVEINAYQ